MDSDKSSIRKAASVLILLVLMPYSAELLNMSQVYVASNVFDLSTRTYLMSGNYMDVFIVPQMVGVYVTTWVKGEQVSEERYQLTWDFLKTLEFMTHLTSAEQESVMSYCQMGSWDTFRRCVYGA
jgi:hypothetical protein